MSAPPHPAPLLPGGICSQSSLNESPLEKGHNCSESVCFERDTTVTWPGQRQGGRDLPPCLSSAECLLLVFLDNTFTERTTPHRKRGGICFPCKRAHYKDLQTASRAGRRDVASRGAVGWLACVWSLPSREGLKKEARLGMEPETHSKFRVGVDAFYTLVP